LRKSFFLHCRNDSGTEALGRQGRLDDMGMIPPRSFQDIKIIVYEDTAFIFFLYCRRIVKTDLIAKAVDKKSEQRRSAIARSACKGLVGTFQFSLGRLRARIRTAQHLSLVRSPDEDRLKCFGR
jgi:hypothetical protein